MITMEHRWGARQRVRLGVRIRGPGLHLSIGWLTDLSLSGAYVHTTATLASASQIHVELAERYAGHTGQRHRGLPGRVVRHGPGGIGIEWDEFASEVLCGILQSATRPSKYGGASTDARIEPPHETSERRVPATARRSGGRVFPRR
jgi:hypothetical protein